MTGWRAWLTALAIGAVLAPGAAFAQTMQRHYVDFDHGRVESHDNGRGRDFERGFDHNRFFGDEGEGEEVHPYFTPEYHYHYDYDYTPLWTFGGLAPNYYYYGPNNAYGYNPYYGYNRDVPYRSSNPAYSMGYHYGLVDGQHDRLMGESFRPRRDGGYHQADRYYSSTYGSESHFKRMYRDGFLQGYIAGYDG